MEVILVMFKRDGQRKDFTLQKKNTVIGRGEDCGLRIPLLNVSRRHCEIIKGQDELRIRDLASSNGSYVNNRRINETTLKAGDRLVVGPVVFTVQVDGVPQEITPIKTKAQKAADAVSAGPGGADDEVIELEPDVAGALEETDPIAALEAMAADHKTEDDQKQKKNK
jgi:pSer/pThr/pTyr-binding forkhead associated (FHA) protein